MTKNPLLAKFSSEPALIEPSMDQRFASLLSQVVAHPKFAEMSAEGDVAAYNDDNFWPAPDDWRAAYRPYKVSDGVLQIPVKGVLLHDFPFTLGSWATGYAYILRAFQRGVEDFKNGAIKGIAFLSDSPGGMVAGCFDAVDKMFQLKQESGVPVRGFAHEMAYSAAYAIVGGVADHIAMSRTAGVGSVGVVTMHADMSKMMDDIGYKITFIHAGKHKVDGNAYQPLPDDVRARIQGRIDEMYDVFVSAVARGRGMEEQAVRDTEALTFTASQALENGFADSVGTLEDAISAYADELDDLSDNSGDDEMADANQSAVDQAAEEAAVAAAREEGRTAGLAEGATAEQARIAAILDSDEAEGRTPQARHLAFSTRMSVEDAKGLLAVSAKEAVAPATGANNTQSGVDFTDAMANGNPEVGAGNGTENGEGEGGDILASLKGLGALAG